ncbi:hypothetical protein HMPREF9080_02854 [Cardiobacterium valvarum F0432]|uniref:Uncharacterized protein n=1 Tax=Cardiobacterium valvarum F0432 TaxID=797473 RepID=G9ZJ85_9GAMM|nr:hypothetical protein HMPREF9080_02854 [Cardiobacterium valvarum F0432]
MTVILLRRDSMTSRVMSVFLMMMHFLNKDVGIQVDNKWNDKGLRIFILGSCILL